MIYLDNSSTTPLDTDVIDVMLKVMKKSFGNPSSLHEAGMKADHILDQSRKVIADELGSQKEEVIFTSGGTEANNLAVLGAVHRYKNRGNHVITTQVEHESVQAAFRKLKRDGFDVTTLPVDSFGRVCVRDVKSALRNDTILISVIHVNNEVGTIQPIREIGELVQERPKVIFHVDAVQSFSRIPLFPRELSVDLLSFSAHKIHGPKGVGGLYKSKNIMLQPLSLGGGQEYGIRSGTQNVPGIAGMAKAVLLCRKSRCAFMKRCAEWKDLFITRISHNIQDVRINGDTSIDGGAPYIISVSFPSIKSEVLLHALEDEGIYVGTKSACSSKQATPSRVLLGMGLEITEALGTIRISMGYQTEEHEIVRIIEVLEKIIPYYQEVMKV